MQYFYILAIVVYVIKYCSGISSFLMVICDRKYIFVLKFGHCHVIFQWILPGKILLWSIIICFIQCNVLILDFGIICSLFLNVGHTQEEIYAMFPYSYYSQVRFQYRIWTKGLHFSWWLPRVQFEDWIWKTYIMLEITLIHFQIGHTQDDILYCCGIYTMLYMVTIINVCIQSWILSYKVYSMLIIAIIIIPIDLRIYAAIQVYLIRIQCKKHCLLPNKIYLASIFSRWNGRQRVGGSHSWWTPSTLMRYGHQSGSVELWNCPVFGSTRCGSSAYNRHSQSWWWDSKSL